MVHPTLTHWPAVLWSLETASGFSQRTVYQTDRGKRPKSTSSPPNRPPPAVTMNSGLHSSFWAYPTNFPCWYSNTQEDASSWSPSSQQQDLQMAIRINPHAAEKSFWHDQGAAVAPHTLPRHPSSSCTHLLVCYRHNQLPWPAGVPPALTWELLQ